MQRSNNEIQMLSEEAFNHLDINNDNRLTKGKFAFRFAFDLQLF